jgi:2-oxoglutarate ferredoxin oxidoreductase subunit beta
VQGEPLLFGAGRGKGLRLAANGLGLEVAPADDPAILRHDETDPMLATLLAALEPPMPVAIGVLLDAPAPTYETQVAALEAAEADRVRSTSLNALLRQGATWSAPG